MRMRPPVVHGRLGQPPYIDVAWQARPTAVHSWKAGPVQHSSAQPVTPPCRCAHHVCTACRTQHGTHPTTSRSLSSHRYGGVCVCVCVCAHARVHALCHAPVNILRGCAHEDVVDGQPLLHGLSAGHLLWSHDCVESVVVPPDVVHHLEVWGGAPAGVCAGRVSQAHAVCST